jgi:hypothetical protein
MQESTGIYDVGTNPGGYGTPNIESADAAQYVFAFKKNVSTGDDNYTSLVNNTTPENGVITKSWTLDISEAGSNTGDGWYEFNLLVCPIYNGATAYTVNEIVSYGSALYICIQNGTGQTPDSSPTYWSLVNLNDTVANLEAILDNQSTYSIWTGYESDIMLENTEIYYSGKIAYAANNCTPCADFSDEIGEIEYLEFYLRSAYANESKENWTAAEKNVEILKDIMNGKVSTCL